MFATTFVTNNESSRTACPELPDVSSNVVTLNKVNQDAYGSEYRFGGTHLDYVGKIRSSYESPRADGSQYTRHNVEFSVMPNNATDRATYGFSIPLFWSATWRIPVGRTPAGVLLAGSLANAIYGKFQTSNGGFILPIFNFES